LPESIADPSPKEYEVTGKLTAFQRIVFMESVHFIALHSVLISIRKPMATQPIA